MARKLRQGDNDDWFPAAIQNSLLHIKLRLSGWKRKWGGQKKLMFKQRWGGARGEGASKQRFTMISAPSSCSSLEPKGRQRRGGDWKAGAVIMGWPVTVSCCNETLCSYDTHSLTHTHTHTHTPFCHLSLPIFVRWLIRSSVFDNPRSRRSMNTPAHSSCCWGFWEHVVR